MVQQLPWLPTLWWALAAVPPLVLARWRPMFLIPACFVLGAAWAIFRAGIILNDELARELEGQDLVLIGYVADLPKSAPYGVRFLFDVETATLANETVRV